MVGKIAGSVIVMVLMVIWAVYGIFVGPPPAKIQEDPAVSVNHIIDNVYVGNWAASVSQPMLKRNKIGAILTLNYENRHNAGDENMFKELGIKHKVIIIQDSQMANIKQHLNDALNFVAAASTNKAAPNVLIHCTAGISRSASVAIAYVIRKKKYSAQEALNFVKSRRPIVWPNNSFFRQLDEFARSSI